MRVLEITCQDEWYLLLKRSKRQTGSKCLYRYDSALNKRYHWEITTTRHCLMEGYYPQEVGKRSYNRRDNRERVPRRKEQA